MSAPHLYTLTGNLLCERTLEFSDWSIGRTQRAVRESFQVGGKGINVAKMLQRLGAPTTALCFVGGPTGMECSRWLGLQPFAHRSFPTTNDTRVGIVIRDDTHPETTFMGVDAIPDVAAIAECVAFLDAQPPGQLLAICGSVPGWISPEFETLRAALLRWQQRGLLVVDTYGPPLGWLVAQPLDLVKINAVELRTLFPKDTPDSSTPDLIQLARGRWPTRRWIVTDGSGPVWFCEEGKQPEKISPPKVVEVSPTGSGDVFLACVLEFYFRQKLGWPEAIRRALPYSAANAAHPGIADFPLP
ncbi:MAG: PfkB domain protein [Verrucomicrobia bacterium]|nr:PfkB domain protein [Verrucomicrobiota bacterium]